MLRGLPDVEQMVTAIRSELDEDERVAQEASKRSGRWLLNMPPTDAESDMHQLCPADLAHAERHDPARVLRQVAVHREILDLHAAHDFPYDPEDGPGDYSWTPRCDHCHHQWPCPTIRALATAYADRDDEIGRPA